MNNVLKRLYRKAILLYLRYKDSPYYSVSLYVGILVVSLLLVLYVVIPEVGSWLSVQEEVKATRERTEVMQRNAQLLESLRTEQLNSDFTTASTALPPSRDISLLVSAINVSAIRSGVGMDDFTFAGGEVSSKSTATAKKSAIDNKLIFTVKGTLPQLITFLGEMQQKMPLLSLSSVTAEFTAENSVRVTLNYFYKAFPLISANDTDPITDLTPENKALLEKLRSWQVPLDTSVPVLEGSESASPL